MKVKMKTAELIGAALNWAVAKAEGWSQEGLEDIARGDRFPEHAFSTEWAQGGPIIDSEHIGVAFNGGQWVAFYMADELDENSWDFKLSTDGPTALIAAMRCYVAERFGALMEVPQELLA